MRIVRALTGPLFIVSGLLHFKYRRAYESIVPDYLPAHRAIVYASGVAEIAGGAAILSVRTRPAARWWLLATLLAVYPANIHMAMRPERFPRFPRALLWARLPVQGVFALLTWRGTRG